MNGGFTNEELTVLEEVIKEYLTELRMEIADTDDFDFRQGLKKKSETLQGIIAKLEKSKAVTVN
ncbi:MAG: hypothetical protein AAB209_03220 [Bacteroidota bacterium]|jgi:hypothetical protein